MGEIWTRVDVRVAWSILVAGCAPVGCFETPPTQAPPPSSTTDTADTTTGVAPHDTEDPDDPFGSSASGSNDDGPLAGTASGLLVGRTTGTTTDAGSVGAAVVDPVCGDGVVVDTEVCFRTTGSSGGKPYQRGVFADFDGDQQRDLLYADASGGIEVRINTGGAFGLPTPVPALGSRDILHLEDIWFLSLNGDRMLDALLIETFPDRLSSAHGESAPTALRLAGSLDISVAALTLADLTADGREEAVVVSSDTVQIFEIDPHGRFVELSAHAIESTLHRDQVVYATGAPVAVRVADFNGDDAPDVVLTLMLDPLELTGNGAVPPPALATIYLGAGDGTLAGPPAELVETTAEPTDLAVGDFNGDGAADFALAEGDQITTQLGDDALNFESVRHYVSGTISVFSAADFDLDGIDDLVVGYRDRDAVSVYLGSETGQFSAPVDLATSHPVEQIGTGDTNADRVPDIVVTSSAAEALTVLTSDN